MKKIVVGIVIFIFVISGISTAVSKQQAKSKPANQYTTEPKTTSTPTPQYEYEIIETVDGKTDQNVSVLVKTGEKNPKAIYEEVKNKCKKQCNVSLFDDKKAFDLDKEYTKMMTFEYTVDDREAWKKANTVFLAGHLIASGGYSYGDYKEYPLQDSYYRELKNQVKD